MDTDTERWRERKRQSNRERVQHRPINRETIRKVSIRVFSFRKLPQTTEGFVCACVCVLVPVCVCIRPEEDVEAEHGEHDSHVAQNPHSVAQLVDKQEPLIHHPVTHTHKHIC